MLLRLSKKRLTSVENTTLDVFLMAEFRTWAGPLDLQPSVYECGPAEAERARVEHCAAAGLDNLKNGEGFDVAGIRDDLVRPSPVGGPFSFLKTSHRHLEFDSKESLRSFASVLHVDPDRLVRFPKSDSANYVVQRVRECDSEWREYLLDNSTHRRWLKIAWPALRTNGSERFDGDVARTRLQAQAS